VYPWPLRANGIRPFVGVSWLASAFSVGADRLGEGPDIQIHDFPVRTGLGIVRGPLFLELMAQYVPGTRTEYAIPGPDGDTAMRRIDLPRWQAGVSFRYRVETTRTARHRFADDVDRVDMLRRQRAWNTVYAGIGVTSAFFTRDSQFNRELRPAFDGTPVGRVLPEVHAGYHWADRDLLVDATLRNISDRVTGWGAGQRYRRRSLAVEASRFLFDFHGFAPFGGAGVSREWLSFRDDPAAGDSLEIESDLVRPSFVVGWDIRPAKTMAWFIRTALRYTPGVTLDAVGRRVPMPDFEFNFFQFVLYPFRF
jgi:hypothetical protein